MKSRFQVRIVTAGGEVSRGSNLPSFRAWEGVSSSELTHMLPFWEKVKWGCLQGVSGVGCAGAGGKAGFWDLLMIDLKMDVILFFSLVIRNGG